MDLPLMLEDQDEEEPVNERRPPNVPRLSLPSQRMDEMPLARPAPVPYQQPLQVPDAYPEADPASPCTGRGEFVVPDRAIQVAQAALLQHLDPSLHDAWVEHFANAFRAAKA